MKSRFFAGRSSSGSGSSCQQGRFVNLKSRGGSAAPSVEASTKGDEVANSDRCQATVKNRVNGVEVGSPGEVCSICLSSFDNASRTDGCAHQFCWACICIWAKISVRCPMCKAEFGIVQSLGQPDMLQQFEAPLPDSESEDEDDDGDDDEMDEEGEEDGDAEVERRRQEGVPAASEAVDGSEDEYVYDGFVVGDDEIEYEEDFAGAEAEKDIADFATDSEGEKEQGRERGRKKKRRRTRFQTQDDDDEDDDNGEVDAGTPIQSAPPLAFSSFAFRQ